MIFITSCYLVIGWNDQCLMRRFITLHSCALCETTSKDGNFSVIIYSSFDWSKSTTYNGDQNRAYLFADFAFAVHGRWHITILIMWSIFLSWFYHYSIQNIMVSVKKIECSPNAEFVMNVSCSLYKHNDTESLVNIDGWIRPGLALNNIEVYTSIHSICSIW